MVDQNDAPEGFIAVKYHDGCSGCYFYENSEIHDCPKNEKDDLFCCFFSRNDRRNVILIKKENMNEIKTEVEDELEFFDGHEWRSADKKLTRKKIKHGIWVRNYIDTCVVVRSINTRLVVDLEEEKTAIDDALNCHGYSPLNEWTFYEVDLL